ncbi:hypothetical protein AQUCO_02700269v1 [Aquilegia coerulea]|uniref:Uncharacterized protein n=1 Tax=Aquilegia coerulea TaxID=218851 RepID=A0A2G5D648_AQUCA|nr:hypothetical protein AQUCO_02700269v1 [Aquilegia coerulea]
MSFKSQETISSEKLPETHRSGNENDFPVVIRRRNQSWSAVDLHEYKVYKTDSTGEYAGNASDASTQTDDKRRRRRSIKEEEEDDEEEEKIEEEQFENHTTELNREEISPPPSSSSPETLETLIKADGSIISTSRGSNESDICNQTVTIHPSGRMKASTVLMQLISCGSFSMKDYRSENDQGFSLISHYKTRIPRGVPNQKEIVVAESPMQNPSFGGKNRKIQLEDKEYFSGSLIETKKNDFSALKRSSSYNADRSSKLELKEEEIDGVRAKCIPRRSKMSTKKESSSSSKIDVSNTSTTGEGSKRFAEK